jgi:uncharacterized repeat protein (TIGR01451 family)
MLGERMSASEPIGHGPMADDCLPKDPPPPVVKIKVRVPAGADPGRTIEYRICVENCSTSEAHHVVVKNALPVNAKFIKADPEPSKQGPELQWNLGTIGGGGVREIILFLQPTNKEDIKNCARVQFEHGQCVVTRQALLPGDRPPIISTVPDTPRPEDLPVLDLEVTGPKERPTNLDAKYFIVVTNKGKTKATNLQVSARLPNALKFKKASAPGVAAENVVAWNLGHLDAGARRVLDVTLQATEKGEHRVRVTAEADLGLKKEVDFSTLFSGVSALSVEMIDSVDPVFLGEKTGYPVVIRNQGSEPVANVRVKAFISDAFRLEKTSPELLEKREPIKGGEWIEFKALPRIDIGAQVKYEVFVEASKGGVSVFHVEILADGLESGRIIEQELTTVVDDRAKVKVKELSRQKNP